MHFSQRQSSSAATVHACKVHEHLRAVNVSSLVNKRHMSKHTGILPVINPYFYAQKYLPTGTDCKAPKVHRNDKSKQISIQRPKFVFVIATSAEINK